MPNYQIYVIHVIYEIYVIYVIYEINVTCDLYLRY